MEIYYRGRLQDHFERLQNNCVMFPNCCVTLQYSWGSLHNDSGSFRSYSVSLQNDRGVFPSYFVMLQNRWGMLQNGFVSLQSHFATLQNGWGMMQNGWGRA